jgi:putative ABC transport system ATP-binding protein
MFFGGVGVARVEVEVMIELAGLTKVYKEAAGERVVFRDLYLRVQEGEVVVLLGPSGSGKSTLLNLVSGIDLPTSGEVRIDGVALTSLTERQRTLFRRDRLGFVFQFFNLIPTLSVEENVLLPLELSGRDTAADHARARALLADVGLGDRAGAFPDRLSGGEQQRVAVARALAHDPAVVLADEPTGNLDRQSGGAVLGLLERLARGSGKTVLIVTHSEEAAGLADRVLVLRDGGLVTR